MSLLQGLHWPALPLLPEIAMVLNFYGEYDASLESCPVTLSDFKSVEDCHGCAFSSEYEVSLESIPVTLSDVHSASVQQTLI